MPAPLGLRGCRHGEQPPQRHLCCCGEPWGMCFSVSWLVPFGQAKSLLSLASWQAGSTLGPVPWHPLARPRAELVPEAAHG